MMNRKLLRGSSFDIINLHPGIFLTGMRKTTKVPLRICRVPVEIRTKNLRDATRGV
jgi:hypothetical protein